MSNNAVTEVGEFFTGWETYRKVLENNYMYHQEIYQAAGTLLHQQFAHQPFKLLDLGVWGCVLSCQRITGYNHKPLHGI